MSTSGDRSFTNVLEDIAGNIQAIVRSEVRLAKTEIQEEAVKAGRAAGVAGAGGVLGLYAVGFVLLACVYALELALAPWLAALIVGVVAGAGAAVLIQAGRKGLRRVHPRPDRTIHTVKENLEWAKNQTR